MSFPAGKPCMCPRPDDPADLDSVERARNERARLAGLRPPQACKPLTRINVTISDLPGLLGVWKLNTGSENAAVETADAGEMMAIAREGGVYLPAVLRIEWRARAVDGKPYPVPVLQIGLSMREIAAGALPAGPAGLLAQLQGAAQGERQAITAASGEVMPDDGRASVARTPPPAHMRVPLAGQDVAAATNATITSQGHPLSDDEKYKMAQAIADECAGTVTPERFRVLQVLAKTREIEDEFVYITDDRTDGPCLPLGERLDELRRQKIAAAQGDAR